MQDKTISEHKQLLETISRADFPRSAAVLNSTFITGRSVQYTIEMSKLAAARKFRPRNYTNLELDLAILTSGSRSTYALSQYGVLPSRRTLDNYAQKVYVAAQVGRVTLADLERSIEAAFLAPRRERLQASGAAEPKRVRWPSDETQIQDAPSLIELAGEEFTVGGFCVEDTSREDVVLKADGYDSVLALAQKYREGKRHLARQVHLSGFSVAGEHGLIPVLAGAPTCKSQTTTTAADML